MQGRRYNHLRSSTIALPVHGQGATPLPLAPPLLPEGESLELPLLLHRTMCLPGQHFRISGLSLAAGMFICDLDPPRMVTFGLVVVAPGGGGKISRYGVTFDAGPHGDYREDISVRARGKQRFRVLGALQDLRRYRDICLHRVRILPELPYGPMQPPKGLRCCWPDCVLRQYDPVALLRDIERLVGSLASCCDEDEATDPSYRVAVRLHLADDVTERLLQLDAPVLRLQYELDYVRRHRHFNCAICIRRLANVCDLIAVHNETLRLSDHQPDGQQQRNSLDAWLREPITLLRAAGVTAHPGSSVADTRFPGYVWSPAFCASCFNHVGWRFRAEKGGLSPNEFWALCKRSVVRKPSPDDGDV